MGAQVQVDYIGYTMQPGGAVARRACHCQRAWIAAAGRPNTRPSTQRRTEAT